MARSNLDSGFLILYDWVPALDALSGDDVKLLLKALINRQRHGTPLPDFGGSLAGVFAQMIEPTIKRRIAGQRGRTDDEIFGDTHGDTLAATSSRAEQSKAEQSTAQHSAAAPVQAGGGGGGESGGFDEFWAAYPKHTNPKGAKAAYEEEVHSAEDHRQLMELLARWKCSDEWREDGGKWVKRADKFLREVFHTKDEPPQRSSSFDVDEFFEAALRRSYSDDYGDSGDGG